MLTFKNLFSHHEQQEQQEFFEVTKKLQQQHDNLCSECSRLSNRYYEFLNANDEKNAKIALEYLEVQQEKLDQFTKKYDVKF